MDFKNSPAFVQRGQVEEEDFIEATLAEDFRRQLAHVVRRRYHEYRRGLLLQPSKYGAKHARAGAAVHVAVGKRLLHLVDPQYRGTDGLGELKGLARALFRFADV